MLKKQKDSLTKMALNGFKLIPLIKNTKTPFIPNWPDKGTTNIDQIEEWALKYPDCNFGITTGDGLVVLDVDNKNGKNGSQILSELNETPNTYTVKTPNGGYHYYFKTNESIESRNYGNGLEIKSSRNQVVAPYSTINGKTYEIKYDIDMAEFPMWLFETLESTRKSNEIYSNVIPLQQVEWSEDEKLRLETFLEKIDPDLDYETWLKVIYACINIYGHHNETWTLLKEWSSKSGKYNEVEFWKRVNSYNPNHTEKIGYKTLSDIQWSYPKKYKRIESNDFGFAIHRRILAKAVELLEKHGTKPSKEHLVALEQIIYAMSHGIESTEKFRLAFPLETGMGKTTCVVAAACVLQPLNKSLLICAEQIEQLGEMRESMISAGINPNSIGIYHKVKNENIPSIKLEEMHKYQILLTSHSRINNDSKNSTAERLLTYMGEKRNLTIWDESLITTDSYYCSLSEMKYAISDWVSRYTDKLKEGKYSRDHAEEYVAFYEYLLKVKEVIDGDILDSVIELPYVSSDILNRKLINSVVANQPYRMALETLITFNKFGEVRVIRVKDGAAIIQFEQLVDNIFDKIIVMDASSRIRKLLSFDETISVFPLGINKSYEDIDLFHADVNSSKSSFESDRYHLKNHLKEFEHLLDNIIPKREPLIIFCHKDSKEEINNWKQELYPLREIHVIHWGQHKATNKYSHVKYIFTCGILYRDWKEVSSSIIAQTGNLNYSLLDNDVKETYYSEQAEMLYQGFSRGSSRNTMDGKAGKQTIYMFHPIEDYNNVMASLRRVMYGIRETKYNTKYLIEGRKNARDYLELDMSIRNYLISLEEDVLKLNKSTILNEVAPELKSNSKTWRKAISRTKEDLKGWTFNRHIVERNV